MPMKTFEEFVESRKQMDPTAQKMSEHQWQQAYTAYRSSRERLRKSSSSDEMGSSGERRRRPEPSRSSKRSGEGAASSSDSNSGNSVMSPSALRQAVRQRSAYSDVRTIVDVLSWVAVAVILGSTLLKMMMGIGVPVVLSFLVDGSLGVIVVFVLKMLMQVIIDIPDIALYKRTTGKNQS